MGRLDCSDAAIKDAVNDVKSDSDTDFVVFKYVPKTDKIKVKTADSGELEDMQDELNDGQVHYVYMRFKVGDMAGYKYVYFAWCGEGVSGMARGQFANHATDFENFLEKNMLRAHVRINARSEADLDEKDIISKINRSKGANFVQVATRKEGLGPSVKDQGEKYWKAQKNVDAEHKAALQAHEESKKAEYDELRRAEEAKQKELAGERIGQMERDRQAEIAHNQQSEQARAAAFEQRRQAEAERTLGAIDREKDASIAARSVGAHNKEARADMPEHNKFVAPAPAPSARAPEGWEAAKSGADRVRAEESSVAAARQSFGEHDEPEGRYQYDNEEPAAAEPEPAAYDEPAPANDDWAAVEEEAADPGGYDEAAGDYEDPAAGGEEIYQMKALYEYAAENEGDLALNEGDIISVTHCDEDGWLTATNLNTGLSGACPSNFCEKI